VPVRYVSRYSPRPTRTVSAPAVPAHRRSHAAAYAAFVVLLLGLWLSSYSFLFPALLGLLLLGAAGSFLSSRLNPFSTSFYLSTKPSWSSIGVLFLFALVLGALAYSDWRAGRVPALPRFP
jgi:hypothetical protein